jgi:ABC-type lipoprotein export system ATPase subunit
MQGCVCAVTGPSGSGKSTLLAALLGDACLVSGSCSVAGTCAFAPQVPWLVAASIKQNILMDRPFDLIRYAQVCGHVVAHVSCKDKPLVNQLNLSLEISDHMLQWLRRGSACAALVQRCTDACTPADSERLPAAA